jgi:hypothetical protein
MKTYHLKLPLTPVPTPIPHHPHPEQTLSEYTLNANARNKARHYIQKNEPTPISEGGLGTTTPSSASELNPSLTSLLS